MSEYQTNIIVANVWMVGAILHPNGTWSAVLCVTALFLLLVNRLTSKERSEP
jgi:nitrate reductase gamma subunit